MVGQYPCVWTDLDAIAAGYPILDHAGMNETNIGTDAVLFTVEVGCLNYFAAQVQFWIIVEP